MYACSGLTMVSSSYLDGQSDTSDGLTELGHGAGWEVCTTAGLPGFVAIPWLYLINLPGNVYLFA